MLLLTGLAYLCERSEARSQTRPGNDRTEHKIDAETYLKAWNDALDTSRAQGLILESDLDAERARGRTIAAALWR